MMQPKRLELSADQLKVQHLIDYSNSLTDLAWSYEGEIVAAKGDREFVVPGSVTWNLHAGQCALTGPVNFSSALQGTGSYGQLVPAEQDVRLSAPDGAWRSPRSSVVASKWNREKGDSADLKLFELVTGDMEAVVSSQGIVLSGVEFVDYPTAFPTDDSRYTASVDGMITTVFGRPAIIRKMRSQSAAGSDVLVAFDGDALEKSQQFALLLVLSSLAGRLGVISGRLGFANKKEIWQQRYAWPGRDTKPKPPGDWHRGYGAIQDIPQRMPGMLDTALVLIQSGIRIDVALTHLFADSRGQLDVEIRDITLALDALVESLAFVTGKQYLIEQSKYENLVDSLETPVNRILKEHDAPPDLATSIWNRVKGANDVTHGTRRRTFWERVGFELTSDEKRALAYRHPMSHQGFLLADADDTAWQQLITQTGLARTLVNRVILALLGYDGQVFDYSTGEMHLWHYFLDRHPS